MAVDAVGERATWGVLEVLLAYMGVLGFTATRLLWVAVRWMCWCGCGVSGQGVPSGEGRPRTRWSAIAERSGGDEDWEAGAQRGQKEGGGPTALCASRGSTQPRSLNATAQLWGP